MPRRPRKPKLESVHIEVRSGQERATVKGRDSPENVERMVRGSEEDAKALGLNLKIARSSGKSMVSFSGISKEKWDAIFKKGKGKEKGK